MVLLVTIPTVLAVEVGPDDFISGPNGPSDYYHNTATSTLHYYDAVTRSLSGPLPIAPTEPVYAYGKDIDFFQEGEWYMNESSLPAECVTTFCLVYRARMVGEHTFSWRYRFSGIDISSGDPTEWYAWSPWREFAHYQAGQPLVTGGSDYHGQSAANIRDCSWINPGLVVQAEIKVDLEVEGEQFECG